MEGLDLNDLTGDKPETKATTTTTETSTATAETPAEETVATTETTPEVTTEATTETETEEVATEATTETVEEAATETTDDTIGEAEAIPEEPSVEVPEAKTAPEPTTPSLPYATTNLFNYLNKHKSKIQNADLVNAKFDSVPEGKYMLFVTNEEVPEGKEPNASIYKLDTPNRLHFEDVEPESIIVQNSGVIIKAENRRIYAGKTNVVQYNLVDGSPVRQSTFKKAAPDVQPKVDVVDVADDINMSVEEIKLRIKISPKLTAAVKDLTTKEEIKAATLNFLDEIVDLNHLIKVNTDIMMECGL
jgi:hypothetical protein